MGRINGNKPFGSPSTIMFSDLNVATARLYKQKHIFAQLSMQIGGHSAALDLVKVDL